MESKESEFSDYWDSIQEKDFASLEASRALTTHGARDGNLVIAFTPAALLLSSSDEEEKEANSSSKLDDIETLFLFFVKPFLSSLQKNPDRRFYLVFSNTNLTFSLFLSLFNNLWQKLPETIADKIDQLYIIRPSFSMKGFFQTGKLLCPSRITLDALNKLSYLENALPFHPDTKHTDDMSSLSSMIENLEFVYLTDVDYKQDDVSPILTSSSALLPLIQVLKEDQEALTVQGIFRVSERADILAILKSTFRTEGQFEAVLKLDALDECGSEVKSILFAQLLKQVLYESLACSLYDIGFTERLYQEFSADNIPQLKALVDEFRNEECINVLIALFDLLRSVSQQESVNLMSTRNLGVVFSPTLFPSGSDIAKIGRFELIIRTFLEEYDAIFN